MKISVRCILFAVVVLLTVPASLYASCNASLSTRSLTPVKKDKMTQKKTDNVTLINQTSGDLVVHFSNNDKSGGWTRMWGYPDGIVVKAHSQATAAVYGIGNYINLYARDACGNYFGDDIDIPIAKTSTWVIGSKPRVVVPTKPAVTGLTIYTLAGNCGGTTTEKDAIYNDSQVRRVPTQQCTGAPITSLQTNLPSGKSFIRYDDNNPTLQLGTDYVVNVDFGNPPSVKNRADLIFAVVLLSEPSAREDCFTNCDKIPGPLYVVGTRLPKVDSIGTEQFVFTPTEEMQGKELYLKLTTSGKVYVKFNVK